MIKGRADTGTGSNTGFYSLELVGMVELEVRSVSELNNWQPKEAAKTKAGDPCSIDTVQGSDAWHLGENTIDMGTAQRSRAGVSIRCF